MKKEQEGIIIECNNHIAKVKVARHGDCENCGACPGDNAMVLETYNEIGATKGEHVVFELRDKNMLKAAFIVYVLPLIFIFAGVQTGMFISNLNKVNTLTFGIIGGVIAFLLSVVLIVYYEKMNRTNINRLPKIIRANSKSGSVA